MISDEALAMFELSNDLLFGKIPENRYAYYVESSLHLGREAAKKVIDGNAEKNIFQLYEKAGIAITYQEESGKNYGVSFRAQSEYGKDGSANVMIYRQSISDLVMDGGSCELNEEKALEVHLAHEYFHYLEYHSEEIKDKETMVFYNCGFISDYLEPVELSRIFGRRRTAGILRCSEIAAHAFAKELTGLTVLPNYYDYVYLMKKGKICEADFLKKVKEYEELFR